MHQTAGCTGVAAAMTAAQQGAQAGQQQARLDRFVHIVIGARFQAQHLLDVVFAGGQHQDRHVGETADLPAHVDAAEAGQHQVQYHQLGRMLAAGRAGKVTARHMLHGETMFVEIVADQFGQATVVLHQQDLGRGAVGGGCPGGWLHARGASVPGQERPAAKPINAP